jgi:hypothetical protein
MYQNCHVLSYIFLKVTRLTFQIRSTGWPSYIIPLVFGWHAFHLSRCAGGRGAIKIFRICFIRKVLWIRFRTLASWISQQAFLPMKDVVEKTFSNALSEFKYKWYKLFKVFAKLLYTCVSFVFTCRNLHGELFSHSKGAMAMPANSLTLHSISTGRTDMLLLMFTEL